MKSTNILPVLFLLASIIPLWSYADSSPLSDQYARATGYLNAAVSTTERDKANLALDTFISEIFAIEKLDPEGLDLPPEQVAIDKAGHIYNGAMYMSQLLLSPDNFPLLDADRLYKACLKMLETSRNLFQQSDKVEPGSHLIIKTYTNELKVHVWRYEYELAEKSFESGVVELEKFKGDPSDQTRNSFLGDFYREKGQSLGKRGSHFEALNYLFQALDHYELADDNYYYAACLLRICSNYFYTENWTEVIKYGLKFKEYSPQFVENSFFQNWAMDLNVFMFWAYDGVGDGKAAFQETIDTHNNPFADERYKAYATSLQGIHFLKNEEVEKGRASLKQSLARFSQLDARSYKSKRVFSGTYRELGSSFNKTGQWDSALIYLFRAYEVIKPQKEAAWFWDNYHAAELLGDMGTSFLGRYREGKDQGDLDKADSLYQESLSLLEEGRNSFQEDESKLLLSKYGQAIYEGAIKTAIAREDLPKAFNIAEKAKSNLLFASLQDRVARSASSLPESFLNKEYNLKRQLSLLELKLRSMKPEDETYHATFTERARVKAELNSLVAEIEERDPGYFALKYENKDLDYEELKRQLPQQTSLVEYFAGADSWYIFVLDKDGIQTYQCPRKSEEIIQFSRLCTQEKSLQSNKAFFESTAHQLYLDLLAPLEGKLQKYLTIIPDAELNYLPFDVLFTDKARSDDLPSTYPYFLRKTALSYNFSARLWLRGNKQVNNSGFFRKGLMVFAPEFDPLSADQLGAREKESMKHSLIFQRPEMTAYAQLQNMSSSQEEALRLQEISGTQVWGPSTSPAILGSFLDQAKDYRFIHLATHAKFDSTNHKYSYLAFRPVDNGIDDDRLYLNDLYRIQVPAEMVVLSACETQLGEFFPGEGNASLAQGFAYAGVKSIVATRWSINSEAKAQQMALFYQFLKEGYNKAEALRLSKLEILSQASKYPSPYYWAAPVVMGDVSKVSFFTLWSGLGAGLSLAALALFLGLFWLVLRQRRR